MTKPLAGTIHDIVPKDLLAHFKKTPEAVVLWNNLTPLARNEWICWLENAKLNETRTRRTERVVPELLEGIRRPCCWIGCIHRTDKAISPSVQAVLDRKLRKSY